MKKLLLLIGIQVFILTMASAAEVTERAALEKARAFMASKGIPLTATTAQRRVPKNTSGAVDGGKTASPYYVFNAGNHQGFVIVSGDDRTESILGYADQGAIDVDNMPDGLRYLLDGYAEQLEWLNSHEDAGTNPAAARAQAPSPSRTAIAPLIQTRWDQDAPYSNMCPTLTYTNSNNEEVTEHCVTGCVATSMAQVMNYHRCPAGATTVIIPAYKTGRKNISVAELATTTFDWNNMANTYTSTSTGASADAVAELMHYCGASIQMDYNISIRNSSEYNGSSAYNACIPQALKQYFGYDNGVEHTLRMLYNYQEWVSLLYSELEAGRPIILGGQSTGGGHSFVCDGYQVDDYFHINWGWGGVSDGYFRLTSLAPYEQGSGGSSSLDGFSYGQEAVIGIKPGDGITPKYCLSLEGLQFIENETSSERVFNRSSTGEGFSNIPLYATLCSYILGTQSFDIAVMLVDESGDEIATLYEENDRKATFNEDFHIERGTTPNDGLSFPAGVVDNIYYINIVARPHGKDYWQTCYNASHLRIKAVVNGTALTLSAPHTSATPTCTAISTSANPTTGSEMEVTATIRGGALDYNGNLFLKLNGTRVMGKQADIPANKEVNVRFTCIPTVAGNNTLAIYANSTPLNSVTVNVAESDATMALTLADPVCTIQNLDDDNKLYGNSIRATITLTNNSTDYRYKGTVNCSVREYENEDDEAGAYVGANVTSYPVEIGKNSSTDVPVVLNGFNPGKYYRLRITYYTVDNGKKKIADNDLLTAPYQMSGGFAIGQADGTSTIHKDASTIDAGSACFVDLRSKSDLASITAINVENPNCLFFLASDATIPDVLNGRNVVKGSTAESITLTNGNNFYTPIAFVANNISFKRTFTIGAGESSGWHSLVLPFAVTSVKTGEKTLDWFHRSYDTGKNFWLKTFISDEPDYVYFDYVDDNVMKANTPYIIAVPDDRFGTKWQLTGKEMTFSGTNAMIEPTANAVISGNNYNFCGSTVGQTLTEGYVLNSEGSCFVTVTSETAVPAFTAWFTVANFSSLSRQALNIFSGTPNAIVPITAEPASITPDFFDLQGRKVLNSMPTSKGLYINNGRKVIIK